ncbi:MAG: 4-hydroxy-tetrahydrodipicolinate synthase [Clostridia bacterium]
MKKPIFTGANVAICTPFNDDGSVNYVELERLIEFNIENGTASITICGTTGETCTLNDEEHKNVTKFAVDTVAKRVPVIAGTGSNDTAYAIALSKYAEEVGADALLCVTPYYNKTTQRGLIAHFNAIADSVNIPIILYDVPSRTGVGIAIDTYVELAKNPNINGVKEASGDISMVAQIRAKCGDELNIWSGNDDQIVAFMALGAQGVISVLSNILPKETAQIVELCKKGDFVAATAMQSKYLDLMNALFCEVNPIPVKTALGMMGYNDTLRLPLYEMAPANKEKLANCMIDAGIKIQK